MNRIVFVFIFLLSIHIFPIEKIILKESESINFLEKMEKNEVFANYIIAVDVDDKNDFYFLDFKLRAVLRVDSKSGRLINSISSRGQGPGELSGPCALRVRNQMVFVADYWFGGVKIFNIKGDLLKEFRTGLKIGWLDVNKKNEIFVREADTDLFPVISVYNTDGKRLRKVVGFPIKNMRDRDRIAFVLNRGFIFRLDSKENIVVLFIYKNIIRKYNKKGELLWEKKIANEIIKKHSNPRKPQYGKGGTIHLTRIGYHLEIDRDDNIIVGHRAGCMVFNKDGETINLIQREPVINFHLFKLYNNDRNLLLIVVGGGMINIFNYKKGGKNDVKKN